MKKISYILVFLTGLSFITLAQTVKVGKQLFMIKNLAVSTFRNGDIIPQAKTKDDWIKAALNKQPAWCYLDSDSKNGLKFGKLYNWFAINDPREIAPKGWHLPVESEWKSLINYSGGDSVAINKVKIDSNLRENGNSLNGIFEIGGGYRNDSGFFYSKETYCGWWINFDKVNYVKALANYNLDSNFNKAISQAYEVKKKSQKDFITLFGDAFNKISPNSKLVTIFLKPTNRDKIRLTSSNYGVLKYIDEELKLAEYKNAVVFNKVGFNFVKIDKGSGFYVRCIKD
jgi:uncharacterized protein (TIGR02145 family)